MCYFIYIVSYLDIIITHFMGKKTKPKGPACLLKIKQLAAHIFTTAGQLFPSNRSAFTPNSQGIQSRSSQHGSNVRGHNSPCILKYHSSTVSNLLPFSQDLWCSLGLKSYSYYHQVWGALSFRPD